MDFTDEFDGPAGATPDPRWWGFETGVSGDGQLQRYTAPPSNAALDGAGHLAITAQRERDGTVTSARLMTKDRLAFCHGRVEARIRVPAGLGVWPAFWLLGSDIDAVGWPACGEIDVMEVVGSEPTTVHGTLHGPGRAGIEHGMGTAFDAGVQLAHDFHLYAVDWSADRIAWSFDGTTYAVRTRAEVPPGVWAFDHDCYLLLNLAISGGWPGNATDDPPLPATMLIDRVCVRSES